MSSTPPALSLQPVNVALVQLGGIGRDKTHNLTHAADLVRRAVHESSDKVGMVVLPECFNSPYSVNSFGEYAESFSGLFDKVKRGGARWPIDNENQSSPVTLSGDALSASPSLAMLSGVAKELGIVLVGGSIPERDADNKVYNTSCVFDREGRVVSIHRKLHLFNIDIPGKMTFQESQTLTPGNTVTIFDCEYGRFGLGICYDIRFPENAQIASRRGAGVMLYPGAFNTTTGPLAWELLLRARAVDNQVYTIGCSPARPPEGYPAWGHSSVVDPLGRVVATTEEKEHIVYVSISPDVVRDIRSTVPISTQRRFDVYADVSQV